MVGATRTRQQRQHIYTCSAVASDLDWWRHHRNQPGQFMWQPADTTIYSRYRVQPLRVGGTRLAGILCRDDANSKLGLLEVA